MLKSTELQIAWNQISLNTVLPGLLKMGAGKSINSWLFSHFCNYCYLFVYCEVSTMRIPLGVAFSS